MIESGSEVKVGDEVGMEVGAKARNVALEVLSMLSRGLIGGG